MSTPRTLPLLLAAGLALGASTAAHATTLVTQSLELNAGWNAVWLEVQPTNDLPAVVFQDLDLEQAWTFRHRLPAVDFIRDPDEPVWNRDEWLNWIPAARPESIANTLFAIPGHRAYLLKLASAGTLTVTGTPALRPLPWAPDAFNLRGFPVDPGAPPTFRDFFRHAPAHFDTTANAPRAIHTLGPTGAWQPVAPTDLMRSGTAYWVFSQGGSDFTAPFEVRIEEGGDALEFGRHVLQLTLQGLNRRTTPVHATLEQLDPPAVPALAHAVFSPAEGTTWNNLPTLVPQDVPPGDLRSWRLAPRRQSLTSPSYASLFEIRDNLGTRHFVPVTFERLNVIADDPARRQAGLWIGIASVSAVSEAHSGTLVTNAVASDGTPLSIERTGISPNPTPTRSAFPLRVLIHVDADGTARLLREVTQMWEDGTYRLDAEGRREPDSPGRFVLVTDPARLSRFKGVEIRGDAITGRRFSSVGFDFPGSGPGNADNFVTLSGTFAAGATVSGSIHLDASFPTNPFRHRYHPDHDNLDERFTDFRAEAYAVTRAFSLELSDTDPGDGPSSPDYGYGQLAGTYRETVTGLHRQPIHAEGTFRLRRISEVAILNP